METVTIAASRVSVFSDSELLTLGAVLIGAIVVIVIHRAWTSRNRDLPTPRA
ncbi:MAG: hypothetical protein ACRETT_03330 [Steroidobacteraceae bacterium]